MSSATDATAEKANWLFEHRIASQLIGENPELFIAIDVESGDYEVNPKGILAIQQVRARHPESKPFLRKIGSPLAFSMGSWRRVS